jgi:cysteine-rich repeat protein
MISRRVVRVALALGVGVLCVFACQGRLKETDKSTVNPIGLRDAGSDGALSSPGIGDAACEGLGCSMAEGGVVNACGDGRRTGAEECDDGNRESGDDCDSQCKIEDPVLPDPACGDGVEDEGEECDDANTDPGDGCDDACRTERCGNGRVDHGEGCDPPAAGTCDHTCREILPNCGDGNVQEDEGENCDDGNEERGDGCAACKKECGDDRLERDIGEECEPKYALPDTCDAATCKRHPACGDGKIDESVGEECDPSNGTSCVDCKFPSDAGVDGGLVVPQCSSELSQIAVSNGEFETDVTGWTPGSSKVTATHQVEGGAGPGSIQVIFDSGVQPTATVDGVEQCIPIMGNVQYRLVAEFYNPAANDAGVLPGISIKLYPSANCSGSFTSGSGPPVSTLRDSWLLYNRSIDTSVLGNAPGSLWIKMGPVAPAGTTSAEMWFDSVALGSCGNCNIEFATGELCDDGNVTDGDGCSASCEFECGNGSIESPEQCDDSNFAFGDTCTPSCRTMTTCDTCATSSCGADVDACLGLEGVAASGPARGMQLSTLCSRLRDCMHDTGCHLDTAVAHQPNPGGAAAGPAPEHCYCGTAGVDCLDAGEANGTCRAQVEAALETDDPYQIIQRVGGADPAYPAFRAATDLIACEGTACAGQCARPLACGNGFLEDRSYTFAATFKFTIDRLLQPCSDTYTHTGFGCSFEECEDGNTTDGDGCDSDCFLEACGNYLKQGGEDCDDGNLLDGDGCDSNCVAEFICGDVEEEITFPFEECEPPGTGSVCSLSEYEDVTNRESTCGCDDHCQFKVCGNEIVQEGEECDPPNGASCDDSCQRSIDDCTECMLLLDENQLCRNEWFTGSGIPDFFEVGCLEEPTCLDLWSCVRENQCSLDATFAHCYCGDTADLLACEGPTFVPVGDCKDEMRAAFRKQWGVEANSNSQLLGGVAFGSPNNNPFTAAYYIAQRCYTPDTSAITPLRDQLTASGVAPGVVDACVAACFP